MRDLAICIPAYNRVESLIELLATVTEQLDDNNSSRIQICVSDDSSPNNLEEPTKSFMNNYKVEYIYHRNAENLGADRNFLKSAEISNAKYCWLMGDDDGIPPGKLNTVLEYIDNNPDINVFFGNRYVCNKKLKPKLKEEWTKGENILKEKRDYIVDFTNDDEIKKYFDQLNSTTCLGFLSVLIVKKEKWDSVTEEMYLPYIKTIYIQVAKYLLMLYKKDKLYRITDYIALSRFGNDNFYGTLKQRIFMDLYGFLQLSHIFDDNELLKDSFFGIVRRHFNNIFLNAMSYTAELNEDEINVLKKIGYSPKQIAIFEKRSKFKAFCGFGAAVIKAIFTDFRWFYKTCFVTLQKVK
ncbi:MAG: glycosyltransferase [Oscillospiraceae bacterium]|jgi:abequosyltransferase|nr:glycosyltransferase [Oscillospiraceae bacterium]